MTMYRRGAAVRRGGRPGQTSLALLIGLFATLALGACDETVEPSAIPTASAPGATSTAGTAAGPCVVTDLAVAADPWGAAAGSRGADVAVQNQGGASCSLPSGPSVAILDDSGGTVLEGSADAVSDGLTLVPGASASFTILFSNWCDETVALPLHVVLRVGDEGLQIPTLDLAAGDLPPCNGPDQPPSLSINAWAAS